jgi:raffinose/stachyose/melibiose transport system substrate-binding protein
MPIKEVSRREMLKLLALGTAGTVLYAGGCGSSGASGKFVIVSASEPGQMQPLIKAIKKQHPDVEIEWRHMPSERFNELFSAAAVAGDQIDLVDMNGQDLRRYALGGRLRDLSDVSYKDRFRQLALDTYTIQEKLWALPRGGVSGFTFFYNKKALEKVGANKEPETYDDLLELAPDLKKAGISPFTHPGQNIYLWPVWQFWAYAQTSGNKSVENTFKTPAGDMKFTDPEHVEALEILYRFSQDEMFIDSVNSLDDDAAQTTFAQGKAAFLYLHSSYIATYRDGDFPDLELSLMPPLRAVSDSNVERQLPGGTGSALSMYADIASEREQTARSIMDLMTSDKWVKWSNELSADPVSCNKGVRASDDPLALQYAETCAPNQITYLDWYWPPEITRAFQENQQALVAGNKNPEEAAQAIQETLDQLYEEGYEFES